jgi:hypothetical protein
MRNLLLKGLGAASVIGVLATFTVSAEATDLRAKVPFSFNVAQKTLPPGTYTVQSMGGASTLLLRGSGTGAISLTNAMQNANNDGAKLVFHRYGERYFLREVWSGSTGRQLPEPKIEKELAHNGIASFQVVVVPIG